MRTKYVAVVFDRSLGGIGARDYSDNALDVERESLKRIEGSKLFRVVDKPSQADSVFLVNLDDRSIEGLALPLDTYQQHFKEEFDLDALREGAYGRYLVGPLKFATVSRLSDRLVRQFREKIPNHVK